MLTLFHGFMKTHAVWQQSSNQGNTTVQGHKMKIKKFGKTKKRRSLFFNCTCSNLTGKNIPVPNPKYKKSNFVSFLIKFLGSLTFLQIFQICCTYIDILLQSNPALRKTWFINGQYNTEECGTIIVIIIIFNNCVKCQ